MKFLIILFCAIVIAVFAAPRQDDGEHEWNQYMKHHKKSYDSVHEEAHRKNIFHQHRARVSQHNEQFKKGLVTYEIALNEYSDLTHEEFMENLNGFDADSLKTGEFLGATAPVFLGQAPSSMDWRNYGAVTSIKNQGNCQSCYAFSATGALEGQYALKKGNLISLSEQNIVDCSIPFGNNGCNKGLMHKAYNYIKSNNGIDTEASYPYQGVAGVCQYNPANFGATDVGYVQLPGGNEIALQNAVGTIGPIAVAMDATNLQLYKSGVYSNPNCTTTITHAILAVGYGTDATTGQDYWLIKNSWGTTWGQSGYGMIARNANNMCGIATYAVYPLV